MVINLRFNAKTSKYVKSVGTQEQTEEGDKIPELQKLQRPSRVKDMQRADHMISAMNIKQLYCILAIALNLIQDDIQLSDLTNFIQDGHIGSYNILKYFPEPLAVNGVDILRKIDFYSYPLIYSHKVSRCDRV